MKAYNIFFPRMVTLCLWPKCPDAKKTTIKMRKFLVTNKVWQLFIALLGVGVTASFGQTPSLESLIPKPPEAAAFSKYTDIPVSLYTGVPDISIPIYTLNEANISVPIALSYHASGIKVQDVETWVGLGWTLQPAGMITRTINDKDDFEPANDYFRPNFLIPTTIGIDMLRDIGSGCGLNYSTVEPGVYLRLNDPNAGSASLFAKDWASDIYSFNVLGMKGKFILDQNGTDIHIIGESSGVKIQYLSPAVKVNGFVLTDSKGIRYTFTKGGQTAPNGQTRSHIFSWVIASIQDLSGNTINFEYYTDKRQLSSIRTMSASLQLATRPGDFFIGGADNPNVGGGNHAIVLQEICYQNVIRRDSGNFYTDEPLLKSISSRNVKIDFDVLNDQQLNKNNSFFLERITISEIQNNSNRRTFTFQYGNFGDNGDIGRGKLKLLTLQEEGVSRPYQFTYFNNISRLSTQDTDHWGFYNGLSSRGTIPYSHYLTNNGPLQHYGTNREANIGHLFDGILSSITYPTSGRTNFTYEPHTFDDGGGSYEAPVKSWNLSASAANNEFNKVVDLDITGEPVVSHLTNQVIVDALRFRFDNPADYGNPTFISNISIEINGYKIGLLGNTIYSIQGDNVVPKAIPITLGNFATINGVPNRLRIRFTIPSGSSGRIELDLSFDRRRYASGLRVKRIDFDDNDASTQNRGLVYEYGDQEESVPGTFKETRSYGILHSVPNYLERFDSFWYEAGCDCGRVTISNKSNGNASQIVGYSKVRIKEAGANNGFEMHHFLNTPPARVGGDSWLFSHIPLVEAIDNGKEQLVQYYNSSGLLLQSKQFLYGKKHVSSHFISALLRDPFKTYLHDAWSLLAGLCPEKAGFSTYVLKREWTTLIAEETTTFDLATGTGHVVRADFTYEDSPIHHRALSQRSTLSDGTQSITEYSFPSDQSPRSPAIQSLIDKNVTTVPVTISQFRLRGNIKKLLESEQFAYDQNGRPILIEKRDGAGVLANFRTLGYYPSGNVKSIQSQDGSRSHIIWGFKDAYPIALITNVDYTQIEQALGDPIVLGSANGNNLSETQIQSLRSIPGSQVTTYSYRILDGLTEISDANGVKTSYGYDVARRLSQVRDNNNWLLKLFLYNP